MGEHGQSDVPVPAGVAADLVLVQAAFVLRGLEALLDRPAGAGDAGQFGDLDADWGVGQIGGESAGIGQAAASHHPAVMGGRIEVEDEVGGQLGRCPVVDPRALGPVTAGQPLPGITGCLVDELVDAPDAGQGLDLLGLGTATT
ncbi:hypothetical protein [Streptomyces roseolilacinus]|uniref:hypothetical protein n=1 Tax=Streptomyces roseolilacinus TaxID=66904 RepID=UPI00357172CF